MCIFAIIENVVTALPAVTHSGLAPVLVHLSKDANGTYAYSPLTVNFLVEIVKTIFAFGTLLLYVRFVNFSSPRFGVTIWQD